MASSMQLTEVLWGFLHVLNRWPRSSSELLSFAQRFSSLSQLESYLRANARSYGGRASTFPVAPSWLMRQMSRELGRDVGWLAVPGVGGILIRAAAEGWDTQKTQAAIEATSWWKGHTNQQRQWTTMLPGEQEQLVSQFAARVYAHYRQTYGIDYMESRGWSLQSPYIQGIAKSLAKGDRDFDVWSVQAQINAEGIQGTPAWNNLVQEERQAGSEQTATEDLQFQMEEEWRKWMGDFIPPDQAVISKWAKDVRANKASTADFEKFLRQQSASMYPNKPENIDYATYVSPAKNLVQQLLESGNVRDDDPLVVSYAQGQVPSLADLRARVMADPRVDRTEWFKQQTRSTGTALLKAMGVA